MDEYRGRIVYDEVLGRTFVVTKVHLADILAGARSRLHLDEGVTAVPNVGTREAALDVEDSCIDRERFSLKDEESEGKK